MPYSAETETIFALATAEGRAGVAVIRVSGPKAKEAGEALSGSLPAERYLGRRVFRGADGERVDDGLVVWFAAGRSFTGEDVVELHCHGSSAVVRRLLRQLREVEGLRSAGAGEFTRRAFENGRLDLTQVEGLGDLIEAETEVQRRQAMAVYEGGLTKELDAVRRALLDAAAYCEGGIDFADEEIPEDVDGPTLSALSRASSVLQELVDGHAFATRISDGVEVAIVGAPNAGKSTLLNAIAGEELAIVTDVAGTTRDVIECRMSLGGALVRFLDTAGLRETDDVVEQEGVRRAELRADRADLRIFLFEGEISRHPLWRKGDLEVKTKVDLSGKVGGISAKTGQGVAELLQAVQDRVVELTGSGGLVASERQVELLRSAMAHAEEARNLVEDGSGSELAAQSIRDALTTVEEVVGRVGVEDVLGEIFSSFCIGK